MPRGRALQTRHVYSRISPASAPPPLPPSTPLFFSSLTKLRCATVFVSFTPSACRPSPSVGRNVDCFPYSLERSPVTLVRALKATLWGMREAPWPLLPPMAPSVANWASVTPSPMADVEARPPVTTFTCGSREGPSITRVAHSLYTRTRTPALHGQGPLLDLNHPDCSVERTPNAFEPWKPTGLKVDHGLRAGTRRPRRPRDASAPLPRPRAPGARAHTSHLTSSAPSSVLLTCLSIRFAPDHFWCVRMSTFSSRSGLCTSSTYLTIPCLSETSDRNHHASSGS